MYIHKKQFNYQIYYVTTIFVSMRKKRWTMSQGYDGVKSETEKQRSGDRQIHDPHTLKTDASHDQGREMRRDNGKPGNGAEEGKKIKKILNSLGTFFVSLQTLLPVFVGQQQQ